MQHTPTNATELEVASETTITFHSFMLGSYIQAKKQLEDGVSFIKEEFSFMYDKTSICLNRMALPVNNFLKDLTQIDAEFQQEQYKETGQYICLHGKMMPIEEVLLQPMEENY